MRIEKSTTHNGHGSWVVTVEPGEMALTVSLKDHRGRTIPAKANRTPLRIGSIDEDGKIAQWSVPRGYKEIAKWRLQDALAKLHERGSVFNRAAAQKRKEERRTGMFVIRTTNPSYPENRFHEMKDGYRWVERVLKLSPNGTVAGFFHDKGVYATKPFATQVKSEYGHITHGRLDAWPGSSSSPRASRRAGPAPRAVVIRADGKEKAVKNLGWLLRNWQSVERFEIKPPPAGTVFPHGDALMVAHCRDGARYETLWASKTGLLDWIHRPVFRGIPVDWFGESRKASPRRGPSPVTRPDPIARLVHKGASKIVRLVTGKK